MTRDKVGVGWQHAGGVAGGPKCALSVGCFGGRGHRHQGTATSQRDGGGAGSCEPGAVGTEARLFRNKVLVCGPGHPLGRAGKPTDSAHVGRVPHALAPIPPSADPPVRRPAAAPGARREAGWAPESSGLRPLGWSCVPAATRPKQDTAASPLGFRDSAPQFLHLTGFISAPGTNAPNLKGKSGDCPPFRGCSVKFLA